MIWNTVYQSLIVLFQHCHLKSSTTHKKILLSPQQVVYEYILATKVAMTGAFKEISTFAVDNGPDIGHNCSERGLKVLLDLNSTIIYVESKI